MHPTGIKHIVRHMQKSVVQWSVISKFTCIYIIRCYLTVELKSSNSEISEFRINNLRQIVLSNKTNNFLLNIFFRILLQYPWSCVHNRCGQVKSSFTVYIMVITKTQRLALLSFSDSHSIDEQYNY